MKKNNNPLLELKKAGQSLWIDYLSRDLIRSGELKRLVDEDGLSGVTSNPTIFQKAIEGSGLYDAQLRKLLHAGLRDKKELVLAMTMEDVSEAADMLLPVYESSGGRDGFISIEVSPDLAYDTRETVKEAARLFTGIGRKNILVKVPATKQGLPAIEQLISIGMNVNVTLLFSAGRYREVAEACMKGLEKRVEAGLPVDRVAAFASFFVSRVDTLVDRILEEKARKAGSQAEAGRLRAMRGKAAVANARLAYQEFKDISGGLRFLSLKGKGANVQRLVWGSTGTKDPEYSDIKYVEELIGPDTVNTMPEDTMKAFRDHGAARVTIEEGLDDARALFRRLKSAGIDMEVVAEQLEEEGVRKFSDSFFDVLDKTAAKRDMFLKKAA